MARNLLSLLINCFFVLSGQGHKNLKNPSDMIAFMLASKDPRHRLDRDLTDCGFGQ